MSPLKATLRKTALLRRNAAQPDDRAAWSLACCARLCAYFETIPPAIIAGYVAIHSEADITPALAKLGALHTLALPVVMPDSKVLSFKRFTPGMKLELGAYGIPAPSADAEEVTPTHIITPLVAFDRGGHRLGHGGGYYDTTLGSFGHLKPVIAIGMGFALQEVDVIPAESFDVRLNAVITEKEIITFS